MIVSYAKGEFRMLSCDTFALSARHCALGKNHLAKNSDRPVGEAQPLSFFPGGVHEPGEMLKCTQLTIPQVARTYTVLGSRPYWIWGFEMGVNECGLVIGNEAEWSRCPAEEQDGLLGMDLLRLGLERAATAREGVTVITNLLEQYGQSANAHPRFDRRYENSFLLVDPDEIWLLETAGRQWAARQVHDWAAISNCYSIGGNYDLCSDGLEQYAREHRWLHPDEPFEFARTYTRPAPEQSNSTPRWRRLRKLISRHEGPLNQNDMAAILRDHFEGEINEPRWDSSRATFVSVCMHAATWTASQTAASLMSYRHDVLGQVSRYAPSLPCCSVYIPVYWTGDVPEAMKLSSGTYDERSLWWTAERLAMLISVDESRFAPAAKPALRALEQKILKNAEATEAEACKLMAENRKDAALELLAQSTQTAVDEAMALMKELADKIAGEIRRCGGLYGARKELLETYFGECKIPL